MSPLQSVISGYKRLEPPILYAVAAQFCIQATNTAFFLLLNYYMVKEGYADYEVAEVLSYRFLAAFWAAFPIGLFIKGRRLKPFFMAAAIGIPLFSHLIIYAVDQQMTTLLYLFSMGWGFSFIFIQITILPFILLNAKSENHSEAISLSFLSFSVTICLIGVINYILNNLFPTIFDEKMVLQIVATLSLFSIYFVSKVKIKEQLTKKVPLSMITRNYDWPIIFKAITPTFIIAVGAGFTIPVISLFFLKVHGLPSDGFSLTGSITFFLVACIMIFMPYIRRNFGYRIAITLFQSIAVLALFLLAITEYFREWEYAVYIALFFYVIRQPLMNAAGPMTSELIMYYVGRRNQEIISAMTASIWSGSWFVSMKLFGWLRQMEFRYVSIFLITVALYTVGVVWYATLIRSYERRTGKSGVEKKTLMEKRLKQEVLEGK